MYYNKQYIATDAEGVSLDGATDQAVTGIRQKNKNSFLYLSIGVDNDAIRRMDVQRIYFF